MLELVEFILVKLLLLINRFSYCVKKSNEIQYGSDLAYNPTEMAEVGNVWFDGVDKKLLAAHTKPKTELVKASDKTLVTKVPLPSLASYLKRRKAKNAEQNNSEANTSQEINGSSSKCSNGSANNLNNDIDYIKPNTGITDELALDCEMVECYHHKSVLARVSIVNLFGHPILDIYAAPPSKVTDYRTRWSGIRKADLDNAPDFETVQAEVAKLIKNRIVVGHAIHNDFSVLKLTHPPEDTRDTSDYYKTIFLGKTPSLKKLSESILGLSIQQGEHDSVQDAQATMKLYVHVRDKWNDRVLKRKQSKQSNNHRAHRQKSKPKKKKMKAFYVIT